MKKSNSFSVIIPCYNAARTIGRILDNLVHSNYPRNLFEVIVGYDESSDDTFNIISNYDVVLSVSREKGGPSRARNRGAGIARNDYLIFLDSDVIPDRDTLSQFNRAVNRFPEYDIIQAVYSDASYKSIFSQYQQSWFSYFYCLRNNYETNILSSACLCAKKKLFLKTGGFNIRKIIPAVEDIELGYRLLDSGHRILICTDIQLFHDTHFGLIRFIKRNYDVHNFMLMNLTYGRKDIRGKNPEYDLPVKNLFLSTSIVASLIVFFLGLSKIFLFIGIFLIIAQIWLNRNFFRHIARRTGIWKLIPLYLIFHLDNVVKAAGLVYGVIEYYILKKGEIIREYAELPKPEATDD